MPYVTESAKVNIILPVTSEERQHFHAFMEKFAKVSSKCVTFLMSVRVDLIKR